MDTAAYASALQEWKTLLGAGRVVVEEQSTQKYGRSEFKESKRVISALLPQTREEVVELVEIAYRYGIPLYPVSGGSNWGYGGPSPTSEKCVAVDLSLLNQIRHIDSELGLVTVEPGVTMGQLADYLEKEGVPYMGPVVGIGPHASLIGNMLERGHSTTPPTDRFSSLMSLEAVLADGTIYSSSSAPAFFKWHTGPYLDGLFGQSNFGIVIEATFALTRIPESSEVFFRVIRSDTELEQIADKLRSLAQTLGALLPAYQIQNKYRLRERLYEHSHLEGIPWIVIGTLQGDASVVRAGKKILTKTLGGSVLFFTRDRLNMFARVQKIIPRFPGFGFLFEILPLLQSFISHATGAWKGHGLMKEVEKTSLVFFPAVLPSTGSAVTSFAHDASVICEKYEYVANLGFLSFSERALFVSLPLRFIEKDAKAKERITTCYRELEVAAHRAGGYVQRGSVHTMSAELTSHDPFWRIAQSIKTALDPKSLISPGRYIPPLS